MDASAALTVTPDEEVSLRQLRLCAALLLVALQAAAFAHAPKTDKLRKEAQFAEEQKDYDRALQLYVLAEQQDPSNPAYMLGERRTRLQSSQVHMKTARDLVAKGQLEAAAAEFRKAFIIDPSNSLARQEIDRTSAMIERNRTGAVSPAEANLTPARIEEQEQRRKIESLLPAPALAPILNRITALKMNNQPPKVLYETVCKLAGINAVFDPQMQPARNANLDIANTSLDEALDDIALITKTYWKPVSASTIFVTEDSPTKRRDYEDQVLKVFYLKNVTSVQEFQEIVTAVRSATDIRRMFTATAQNAVVARGTPDQIALASKLFHDLDREKPEVLLDITVLEVNSSHTRDLASSLVTSSGSAGLNLPIAFTPRSSVTVTNPSSSNSSSNSSTPASSTAVSLGQIGKIGFGDFSATLPGALLEAIVTDNGTRILQSPQVRASDGQKVQLKIGDRVPYATGSYQAAAIATANVSPLVSTQFNFADVGVAVEMTPHVHANGDISLHVAVEISSVSRYVNIGGLDQPVISQRKDEADVRMREGEVNLLGGLTQIQNTTSFSGIPGLVNIPLLGKALGSSSLDKQHGELMIALVPHLLRAPALSAAEIREVATGTESDVKVRYPSEPEQPLKAGPPSGNSAADTASPRDGVVSFAPPSIATSPGQRFEIILRDGDPASTRSIRLTWNPAFLRLERIAPARAADHHDQIVYDIRNDTGEAVITRAGEQPVANAPGDMLQISFTAIGGSGKSASITAHLPSGAETTSTVMVK